MPSIVWRQSIVHFLSHSPDLFLSLMNIVWQAKHILNDVVLAQSKMYSDSWMWRLCNCQARQLRYARAIEETLDCMTVDLFRLLAHQAIAYAIVSSDHAENHIFTENRVYLFTSVVCWSIYLFSMFKCCLAVDDSIVLLFACRVRVCIESVRVRQFQLTHHSLIHSSITPLAAAAAASHTTCAPTNSQFSIRKLKIQPKRKSNWKRTYIFIQRLDTCTRDSRYSNAQCNRTFSLAFKMIISVVCLPLASYE